MAWGLGVSLRHLVCPLILIRWTPACLVIKCQGIGTILDVTRIPCAGGNAVVCAEEDADGVAHVDSPRT
jgi:hypothetical protein